MKKSNRSNRLKIQNKVFLKNHNLKMIIILNFNNSPSNKLILSNLNSPYNSSKVLTSRNK